MGGGGCGTESPEIRITEGKLLGIGNIEKNHYSNLKHNSLEPKYCT
jgi:hypothetical protein